MDYGTRKGKSPYLAIEIGAVVVQAVLLGATKWSTTTGESRLNQVVAKLATKALREQAATDLAF